MSEQRLCIEPDVIIINLLKEEKKKYVDIDEIFKLCDYIEEQLIDKKYKNKFSSVCFDVNFNSIERTVEYYNYIFDLIGNRIYLKQNIPSEIEGVFCGNEFVVELTKDFVRKSA